MIEAVGQLTLEQFRALSRVLQLFYQSGAAFVTQVTSLRFRYRLTLLQTFDALVLSAPVLLLSVTFIALMLVVEFSYHIKLVIREDSLVPAFATLLLVRELGGVVTGLLLAARVGAAISAEIGTMKNTDQIDALRVLSIDPIDFLVIPRLVASILATVCLAVLSLGVAIVAGALIASVRLGRTPYEFFNTMFVFVHGRDFLALIVKSAVFGAIIPLLACYHGFRCRPGAQGVGDASTRAVVDASLTIIFLDFVLTYFFFA